MRCGARRGDGPGRRHARGDRGEAAEGRERAALRDVQRRPGQAGHLVEAALELDEVAAEAVADVVRDGVRLAVGLLEEVREAAALHGVRVPAADVTDAVTDAVTDVVTDGTGSEGRRARGLREGGREWG